MRRILNFFLFMILVLSLAACSKSGPPSMPPEDIITKAIERLKSTPGFHFTIDRTGALAFIDAKNTLAVNHIEGDFVTPDKVKGMIRVSAAGFPAEVSIVSITGRYWQTNPLNQTWEEYDPGTVFNPASLFDAQKGIQPMLQTDLSELKLVGNQQLDKWPGQQLYHLSGKMKGERIAEITFGLIGPSVLDVNLWVTPKTFEVDRIQIVNPVAGSNQPTTWTVDFLNYDQKADIQPPIP
jgi:predicted small lipoprotein YifL